jgi:hypothetical protein
LLFRAKDLFVAARRGRDTCSLWLALADELGDAVPSFLIEQRVCRID